MKSVAREINRYDIYIYLLILSLVFGGFGGALMVVRVLAILLLPAVVSKYNYCRYYMKKYMQFFLAFYFFCLLSMIWTPDKGQALKELFYYPVHILIFFEILVFAKFAQKTLKTITWAWLLSLSITLAIAIWEITTSNHLALSKFEAEDVTLNVGGIISERPFAAVTFGNFNGYVAYISFALPFIFYFLLDNKKNMMKVLLAIAIVFTAIVVILIDASRGGLITILIMGLILFLKSKQSPYKFVLLGAAIALVVYYIIPHMDTFEARYGKRSGEVVADSGYGSEENYEYLDMNGIEGYVKYNMFHRELKRKYIKDPFLPEHLYYNTDKDYFVCPMGQHMEFCGEKQRVSDLGYNKTARLYRARNCDGCPLRGLCFKGKGDRVIEINVRSRRYRDKARDLLTSERGLHHRSMRPIEPEAVFGQLKYDGGFRRFHYRGRQLVAAEFATLAIAHNIRKLAKVTADNVPENGTYKGVCGLQWSK